MIIWLWTIKLDELLLQSNWGDLITSYIQFMERTIKAQFPPLSRLRSTLVIEPKKELKHATIGLNFNIFEWARTHKFPLITILSLTVRKSRLNKDTKVAIQHISNLLLICLLIATNTATSSSKFGTHFHGAYPLGSILNFVSFICQIQAKLETTHAKKKKTVEHSMSLFYTLLYRNKHNKATLQFPSKNATVTKQRDVSTVLGLA